MNTNIFDLLFDDKRIIVFSVKDESIVYTWNKSRTIQCWRLFNSRNLNNWEEVDIMTTSDDIKNYEEARKLAMRLHNGDIK